MCFPASFVLSFSFLVLSTTERLLGPRSDARAFIYSASLFAMFPVAFNVYYSQSIPMAVARSGMPCNSSLKDKEKICK